MYNLPNENMQLQTSSGQPGGSGCLGADTSGAGRVGWATP